MQEQGTTLRQRKIARQLQRDFSEMFQKELRYLAAGCLITVTDVWISQDLEQVKVYLSVFPKEHEAEIFAEIQNKTSEIRYQLGKRVKSTLRLVPELLFRLDNSLDEVEKIESILAAIKKDEQ